MSLTIIAAIVLIPLLTTALGGFKSLGDLRTNPFGLPTEWHFENYYRHPLRRPLLAADDELADHHRAPDRRVLTVPSRPMAAFAFAHVQVLRLERFLLNYFLIGLMFPAATAILPLFIRIRDLGLLNTYWGVVLPQVAFGLGMSILLVQKLFLATFRKNCFEAAFVDGCGYLRFFWHISLPLSRPIVATVSIISFVGSWNSYHPAADHAQFGLDLSLAARHDGL